MKNGLSVTGDGLFKALSIALASVVLLIIILAALSLVLGTVPVLERFGLGFFTGTSWNPGEGLESFGALPYLLGTIVTSMIALLVGVPISLGIAVFLSEMSPGSLRTPLSFVIELLAAVPSVIYGLWGLLVFRFWVKDLVEEPLSNYLGSIPAFQGTPLGLDFLTAGLLLAVMIIPTISSVSREVMLAVPNSQREAAYSLGATRWEATRLGVLSYARTGIIGAVILGLGRAVGETMAVTMVIGNAVGADALPTSLLQPGQTMASIIANEFNAADPISLHPSALIGVGLLLFLSAIMVNVFATLLVWRGLKVRVVE